MSFTPTGTPWSRPRVARASTARAWARAWSGSRWAQARSRGSSASIRARQASMASVADTVTSHLLRQHLMDRGDDDRPLAHPGRHALDRARAHVADREHAGPA